MVKGTHNQDRLFCLEKLNMDYGSPHFPRRTPGEENIRGQKIQNIPLDKMNVRCQGDKQVLSSSRQLAVKALSVPTTPLIGYEPAANARTL